LTYKARGVRRGQQRQLALRGYRKVTFTRTVNTAGSTVTRVAEDGSESLYTFDTTLGKYVCHDGGGSFDTLTFTSATQTWTWSWTDGSNQLTELYDNANGGRITKVQDQDGNGLSFTYNAAGLITQVTDADGESTFLDYTGTNLTQLRTVNSAAQTLVRTRYAYDASNRLITVTTDLSPEDASIADGKTYVVSYTYDGTSKRVASLTQTDGNNLSFTYIQVGSDWKVASFTDANGTTSLSYTQGTGSVPATATANSAVLSTTVTTSTNFNLISGALTAPTGAWGTASLRETLGGSSATSPQVSFDQNGNGMACVGARGRSYYSTYTKNTDTLERSGEARRHADGQPDQSVPGDERERQRARNVGAEQQHLRAALHRRNLGRRDHHLTWRT
jgi:YD repeat-containing protein